MLYDKTYSQMSVGGIVLEVRIIGQRCRIWTIDTHYAGDETAIFVDPHGDLPEPGDTIWWQAEQAFWTSADERVIDHPLVKIGYSFDPRE